MNWNNKHGYIHETDWSKKRRKNLVDDSANNEGNQCATQMEVAGRSFDAEVEVCNGKSIYLLNNQKGFQASSKTIFYQ